MELVTVNDAKTARIFLQIHNQLNKNVPGWIQPLDKDINDVFDPETNKAFRHGECVRWLLKNDKGEWIGRIAVFVNKKYKNKGDQQPTGGIGFFDCIDDQQAANFLFDNAKAWLQERGMGAMDGPINFGERERWWGLLTEGFHEPMYTMSFNPPYYQALFENYGFRMFFNQICFSRNTTDRLQEKFYSRHEALASDPGFSMRYIDKSKLKEYAQDFVTVYNKAWAKHEGGKEMALPQAMAIFKSMAPVMDPKIVWFMYYNNEPIGCWLNLPELNQYFKHLHGKFGLLQKLYFLFLKATNKSKKFTGIVFGIVPEFQGKGADAYMIVESGKTIQAETGYNEFEMQWIGDFNPKMINVAESLDTKRNRVLTTYRYLFDRNQEFKRHPMLS
jgi:hypothetical protein